MLGAPFASCNVLDTQQLADIVQDLGINCVVHLATILSAVGERHPQLALEVNIKGTQNVLELARKYGLRVFAPSTIAVFGPDTPRQHTPDVTVMQPSTIYGISKVHQELLGSYYHQRYGVDYRSLRYPGVVSANSLPGGGTTDYAVDMLRAAATNQPYHCFLGPHQRLPMMYMADCLQGTWQLLTAPRTRLRSTTYNVAAMSFSPKELEQAIQQLLPHFHVTYQEEDFRQAIAASWPESLDDRNAREDWQWCPQYDLKAMVRDALHQLRKAATGHQEGGDLLVGLSSAA